MDDKSALLPLILAGLFVFFLCYTHHSLSVNPQEQMEFSYDRESLTVMRWNRIGVILESADDGEVYTQRFDSENVNFVADERKAGTAVIRCWISADTGEILWWGERITLYVSPDDPMAHGLKDDAASSAEKISETRDEEILRTAA